MTKGTIVLASGGTGGHIFPAEALAEELNIRGYRTVLITDSRHQNYGGKTSAQKTYIIQSSSFAGNILKRIKGFASLFIGFFQSIRALRKEAPSVVVGFGGYPSFPTMVAAHVMSCKMVIHEQNSMLGKANVVLAPKVNVIATSFDDVKGIADNDKAKVKLTGNPVRPAIRALNDLPYPDISEDGMFRILVTGGSQGASVFSKVVPEAIGLLPQSMRSRIRVDQQCRPDDISAARAAYDALGISADLATFFTDMPVRIASAHLLVVRSGASTLAELTVAGRPAIMVPYPHSADNHQMANATALEDKGAGWVMPQDAFTPEALSARIESFLNLPSTLKDAAEKSKQAGMPDAAKNLANCVEALIATPR